jgi:hypothetical protein
MTYESAVVVESATIQGVRYRVARMSFGRRVELMRRIRELAGRREFCEAGEDPKDRMEAALLQAEIDRIYLQWGLLAVEGLEVDGMAATPEMLAEAGPEEVFREALAAVRTQTGLSEAERKN